MIYAVAGKRDEARSALARLAQSQQHYDYLSAYYCAAIHALLGEKDAAFNWLDSASHGRGPFQLEIRPEFKTLRSDPRFGELLRKIGLPEEISGTAICNRPLNIS